MRRIFLLLLLGSWASLASPTVSPTQGTVALTFDDGPDPRVTPQILRVLAEAKIHSTFFVVGRMAKANPDTLRLIAQEGHVIANHTYNHPDLKRLSDDRIRAEVEKTNTVIRDVVGQTPKCVRPPYGASNKRIRSAIAQTGLETVLWDLGSQDYLLQSGPAEVRFILSRIQPNQVVLMHDLGRTGKSTLAALPAIIAGIKAKGIGFSTICQ